MYYVASSSSFLSFRAIIDVKLRQRWTSLYISTALVDRVVTVLKRTRSQTHLTMPELTSLRTTIENLQVDIVVS